MSQDTLFLFLGAVALSASVFVCVALLWLRRMRDTVSAALTESAHQQIRTTQRLNEALAQVQKQQDTYANQIQILAQAGLRLQQELTHVNARLQSTTPEPPQNGTPTLH